ncbi:MAG: DUF2344 domain-containing protein [Clostridia bacterium]|nr:DUF2344 domain-containing protein [Clostridia bacterium]
MVSQKEVIPVRIKFSKTGDLMYISHLDLARTMQRIMLRAGIDIWYSEGFNPQPKIVFAFPLSIGIESECELMDIRINSPMSHEEIKERLSQSFPADMKVLDVYTPEIKLKNIAYIDYTVSLSSHLISEKTGKEIEELFKKECKIIKKSKNGDREVDVTQGVKLVEAEGEAGSVKIHAILCADNDRYLNPELFIEAIKEKLGILTLGGVDEHYSIMRNKMLGQDLKEFR